jgi:hypothetical protein
MRVRTPRCLAVFFFCFSLNAQLDRLTLREAEAITERLPEVEEAERRGECPTFSTTFEEPDRVSFQVRVGCGPTGGQMIGSYTVDRQTGAATLFDQTSIIRSPRGEALARRLVDQARARLLSEGEARCLALEAARSFPAWGEKDSKVSVREVGNEGHRSDFTSQHFLAGVPAAIERSLTVDRATGQVQDSGTATSVLSADVGALATKLLALREPIQLTYEDAAIVALRIPEIAAMVPEGCILSVGDAPSSLRVGAVISCGGRSRGDSFEINLGTGEVTGVDQRRFGSQAAIDLTSRILGDQQRRQTTLRREIESACSRE